MIIFELRGEGKGVRGREGGGDKGYRTIRPGTIRPGTIRPRTIHPKI